MRTKNRIALETMIEHDAGAAHALKSTVLRGYAKSMLDWHLLAVNNLTKLSR